MSEEDAALFWEMDLDPAPDHRSDSVDSTLLTRPVSTSKPDDSRRTDASTTPVDESQDTKPVEPVRAVLGQDQTGAPADNTLTPRLLCPQATICTQTDEMNQPRAETSLEDEIPTALTETTTPRADHTQKH